ncbi:MAG: hypothetical protein OXL36_04510 [Bryobacterales bacterium]|nr:hypothetical protein [Bryobacterales bacterium]
MQLGMIAVSLRHKRREAKVPVGFHDVDHLSRVAILGRAGAATE